MNTPLPPDLLPADAAKLDSALSALRHELAGHSTPPAIEAALMQAFTRHHRKRRWQDWLTQWLVPGLGLAASLGAATWVTLAPFISAHNSPPESGLLTAHEASEALPFIALEPLERIAREPAPQLLQTTVPRLSLASMGVLITPENAGDTVHAEMLVSASGQALAMRVIP
ncbi:MAG: hypothetical protein JNM52_04735 [Betaproteobacteria bacterium]|nr:hypothetical protein [Betaproteobacteria bacterium]